MQEIKRGLLPLFAGGIMRLKRSVEALIVGDVVAARNQIDGTAGGAEAPPTRLNINDLL